MGVGTKPDLPSFTKALFYKSGLSWRQTPTECPTDNLDKFGECTWATIAVTVTFENQFPDDITVFWVNGEELRDLGAVKPGEIVSKNTFPTNIFLVR